MSGEGSREGPFYGAVKARRGRGRTVSRACTAGVLLFLGGWQLPLRVGAQAVWAAGMHVGLGLQNRDAVMVFPRNAGVPATMEIVISPASQNGLQGQRWRRPPEKEMLLS